MNIAENKLIDDSALRDELMDKVDILEKVKELIVMPNTDVTTVKQVAAYYEVDEEAISSLQKRNKKELSKNGYRLYRQKEVIEILNVQSEQLNKVIEIVPMRGITDVIIDNMKIRVPSRGLRLFSRRSVLNVGMLLTDSLIAEKVRKYLLDSEDNLDNTQKQEIVNEINQEQLLQLAVINAKSPNDRLIALGELIDYQNKQTDKYKAKVENLTKSDATFGLRDAKNNLGVGERKLIAYLLDNKYCYRHGGTGRVRPYAEYSDGSKERYFTEIAVVKNGQDYTKIALTVDGIEFFRESVDEIDSWEKI